MPSSKPPSFEVHADVQGIRVQIAMGAVGACGALYALWQARTAAGAELNAESLVPVAITLAVFFVFSGVAFKGVRNLRLAGNGATLRIDENGVLDSRLSPAIVPWQNIEDAQLTNIAETRVSTRARDEANKPKPVWVVLLKVREQGTLTLSPEGLETSAEAIFNAVQEHREHFSR